MLPDRVSNPGPLTYESGALPIALRGPASVMNNVSRHHLPCELYIGYVLLTMIISKLTVAYLVFFSQTGFRSLEGRRVGRST